MDTERGNEMAVTFTIKENGDRYDIYGDDGRYLTYRETMYDAECFIGFLSCTIYRRNVVNIVVA
jgi:hypothetical protein